MFDGGLSATVLKNVFEKSEIAEVSGVTAVLSEWELWDNKHGEMGYEVSVFVKSAVGPRRRRTTAVYYCKEHALLESVIYAMGLGVKASAWAEAIGLEPRAEDVDRVAEEEKPWWSDLINYGSLLATMSGNSITNSVSVHELQDYLSTAAPYERCSGVICVAVVFWVTLVSGGYDLTVSVMTPEQIKRGHLVAIAERLEKGYGVKEVTVDSVWIEG